MKRDHLALTFALVFPAVMTWLYFVQFADEGGQGNTAVMLVFGFGKLIQFGFPLVYVWWHDRDEIEIAKSPSGLSLGLFFGVIVGAAMLLLYFLWLKNMTWMTEAGAKVLSKLKQANLASPAGFVALATGYSLVHSLMEEYYWRCFVFGRLRRHMPVSAAVTVSSVGFMAHHVIVVAVYFPGEPVLVALFSLGVAVGGAVWAWLYHRTQSLYAVWLSHALVDAAIMIVGFDMVSRLW